MTDKIPQDMDINAELQAAYASQSGTPKAPPSTDKQSPKDFDINTELQSAYSMLKSRGTPPTGPTMGPTPDIAPSQWEAMGTMERGDMSKPIPGAEEALGAGAASGLASSALFTAGAGATFQATPFLPTIPRVGASIVGGAATSLATGPLQARLLRSFGVPGYEDIPDAYKSLYVMGETFTGFLFPSVGLTSAAKAGFRLGATSAPEEAGFMFKSMSKVGQWFDKNLDQVAKQGWGLTLAGETTASGSAAVAGSVAERYAPGEFWPRFLAETVAGAVNPARITPEILRFAWFRAKNSLTSMAPKFMVGDAPATTAKEEAKRFLVNLFDQAEVSGDDLNALIDLLKTPGVIPESTIAHKTGVPVLSALQHALSSNSSIYGIKSQQKVDDSLKAIDGLVNLLLDTGDPKAFVAAADIQNAQVRGMIETVVSNAETKARFAVAELSKDSARNSQQISKAAAAPIEESRLMLRKLENELYERLDGDLDVTSDIGDQFISGAKALMGKLTPEDRALLPAYIKNTIKRLDKDKVVTVRDLVAFKRFAGDEAADAGNALRFNRSREMSDYRKLAADALDSFYLGKGDQNYEMARRVSVEFHDAFTRSFAGKLSETTKTGAKLDPALLIQRAMAGGGDAMEIRLRELEDTTKFLISVKDDPGLASALKSVQGDYNPEESLQIILSSQERMIRLAVSMSADPDTLRLNPKALQKFIKKNEIILDRMPGLRDDLKRAVKSEKALNQLEKNIPKYGTQGLAPPGEGVDVATGKLAAKLGGADKPSKVVKAVLESDSPLSGLKSLVKIAKTTEGGTDGLRTAIAEAIGDSVDSLDRLAAPLGAKLPTLRDVLLSEGVIDKDTYSTLGKMIDEYHRIQSVAHVASGTPLPGSENTPISMFSGLLSKLGGLHAMSASGLTPSGPASLSANSSAAQISQKILDKMPHERQIKVLQRMMFDKDFAIDMMTNMKELPDKEVYRLMGRVHGYFMRAGFIPTIREEDDTGERRGLTE